MNHPPSKKVGLGILAGISTGIFWGLPFLAPQQLTGFSPLEIAFGRFFFFGLISFLFFKPAMRILSQLSTKDRAYVFLLSASGFWFYSMILFWGIQKTNGIVSPLILGLLPITIPLFTHGRKNNARFYVGLFMLMIGLLNLFGYPTQVKSFPFIGVAALFFCLALWTWFAIQNTRFLQRNPQVNKKDFASLIGIVSLISMLPFFLTQVSVSEMMNREGFNLYLLFSMGLGFGSSWFANWLWNICSYHCPSEVSGPLLISETIFGLLYSFLFEARKPYGYETVSIILFVVGVYVTVTSQMKLTTKPA